MLQQVIKQQQWGIQACNENKVNVLNISVCICLKIRLLNKGVLIAKKVFTGENLDMGQLKTIECFQPPGTSNAEGSPAVLTQCCSHFMPDKTCFQHISQWSRFTLDVSSMLSPCLTGTEGCKLIYLTMTCSYLSC